MAVKRNKKTLKGGSKKLYKSGTKRNTQRRQYGGIGGYTVSKCRLLQDRQLTEERKKYLDGYKMC